MAVANDNEGKKNEKCDVISFRNAANNADQVVAKRYKKCKANTTGFQQKNRTIPN